MGVMQLEDVHRRVVRAPVNPLDRSTVISIFPIRIEEFKPTIQPGVFVVEKGTLENPTLLVVGSSSWWRELDNDQPLLEIPTSSIQVADSIVRDYCNGLLACDMNDKMPGLFFLPGEHTREHIKKTEAERLRIYHQKQKNWFQALIDMADTLWSRTNGNPLAINDLMRLSAHELGIKDKPWMRDFSTIKMENCPACGMLRNALYPICQHCKVIVDKVKFEEMKFQFAQ